MIPDPVLTYIESFLFSDAIVECLLIVFFRCYSENGLKRRNYLVIFHFIRTADAGSVLHSPGSLNDDMHALLNFIFAGRKKIHLTGIPESYSNYCIHDL